MFNFSDLLLEKIGTNTRIKIIDDICNKILEQIQRPKTPYNFKVVCSNNTINLEISNTEHTYVKSLKTILKNISKKFKDEFNEIDISSVPAKDKNSFILVITIVTNDTEVSSYMKQSLEKLSSSSAYSSALNTTYFKNCLSEILKYMINSVKIDGEFLTTDIIRDINTPVIKLLFVGAKIQDNKQLESDFNSVLNIIQKYKKYLKNTEINKLNNSEYEFIFKDIDLRDKDALNTYRGYARMKSSRHNAMVNEKIINESDYDIFTIVDNQVWNYPETKNEMKKSISDYKNLKDDGKLNIEKFKKEIIFPIIDKTIKIYNKSLTPKNKITNYNKNYIANELIDTTYEQA